MAQWLGSPALWWVLLLLLFIVLAYLGATRPFWILGAVAYLGGYTVLADTSWPAKLLAWALIASPLVLVNVPPLSRALFSRRLLHYFRPALLALAARGEGAEPDAAPSWASELIRGRPRWRRRPAVESGSLSTRERRFLDTVVERLCTRLVGEDPARPLSQELFDALAKERFFGLTLPSRLGGRGLSAFAYQSVLVRLASCHPAAACLVAQMNSLGPAALLHRLTDHEGVREALLALAQGKQSTAVVADGSYAGTASSVIAHARVQHDSKDPSGLGLEIGWPGIRLPASVDAQLLVVPAAIGDPDGLLPGKAGDMHGWVLVPADLKGVVRDGDDVQEGPRPAPVWSASGVSVGLSRVAGLNDTGELLATLEAVAAEARAVALPALLAGFAKRLARASGDFARVRRHGGEPVGELESVQRALAQMAGVTRLLDSVRAWLRTESEGGSTFAGTLLQPTLSTDLDTLALYAQRIRLGTPRPRRDAVDAVLPALEWLQGVFGAAPVVAEHSAFPQGLLAGHPHLARTVEAAQAPDAEHGERMFDRAAVAHMGRLLSTSVRSLLLGLTGARLALSPRRATLAGYHRRLVRYSAALALVTEVLLVSEVARLPQRQLQSRRLAEIWALLYACAALLERHESTGTAEETALVQWYWGHAERRVQRQLLDAARNLPGPLLPRLVTRLIFPVGLPRARRDRFDAEVAAMLLAPTSIRDRLSRGMFLGADGSLDRLDTALAEAVHSQALERKLRDARRLRLVTAGDREGELRQALSARVLTQDEYDQLRRADVARRQAIVGID